MVPANQKCSAMANEKKVLTRQGSRTCDELLQMWPHSHLLSLTKGKSKVNFDSLSALLSLLRNTSRCTFSTFAHLIPTAMADPLSVTASVSSLVVISAQIIKAINGFHEAYKDAPLIISSIATECTIIQASLAALQNLLLDNSDAGNLPGSTVQALDTSLVGCALTLSVVDKEVKKYIQKNGESSGRAIARKALFTFEKSHLDELLQQIRGHQVALTLLLTTMQAYALPNQPIHVLTAGSLLFGHGEG